MLDHTIQWLRAYYKEKVNGIPTQKDEAYLIRNMRFNRRTIPNVFKMSLFCFPCGKYHNLDDKHDKTTTHERNEKQWRTEMGYRQKWSRQQ